MIGGARTCRSYYGLGYVVLVRNAERDTATRPAPEKSAPHPRERAEPNAATLKRAHTWPEVTMTQPDFFMRTCARRPSNQPFAVSSTHSGRRTSPLHCAANTKAQSQSAGSETPRWLSARPLRYQRRTCVAVLHILEKGSSSDALLGFWLLIQWQWVCRPLVTSSTGQCFFFFFWAEGQCFLCVRDLPDG